MTQTGELLPRSGYWTHAGKQVLVGSKAMDKAIEDRRKAWKAKHPNAKEWEGAFPYRSIVVVRRDGQAVPQVLRVSFADGSHRDMPVTATGSWQRFEFVTRAKAVSAQPDPDDLIRTDASELNDSRTVDADSSAARRWFGDFTSLLQSLFALLSFV